MNSLIKEIDQEGLATLSVIEKADKFNRWMYETIAPHCRGKILEIGSGIGNLSQCFVDDNRDITLSDLRDNYCAILQNKFDNPVEKIDLVHQDFDAQYLHLLGTFDTVFALNVIEHIQNDVLALKNCHKLLKSSGHIVILVPAYQFLFNNFDIELEHFRRYQKKSLSTAIQAGGFRIKKLFAFNLIGILGWYVTGNLMQKKLIPEGQMGLFNYLVPVFKIADFFTFKKVGLSVICFGEKNTAACQ